MDVRRVVIGHDAEGNSVFVTDAVVQSGTRHRWTNPGTTTARLALFTCGAEHSVVRAAQ